MPGKRGKGKRNADGTLAQFGIFDIPDIDNIGEDDDEDEGNDGDLEAELQALLSGKAPQRKPRPPPKKAAPSVMDVEKMAAECMKDSGSDDDVNLSGDEDLMAELKTLVPGASDNKSPPKVDSPSPTAEPAPSPPPKTSRPSSTIDVLSERLALYKEAESASKLCGDTSKARRYGRAVKTIEGLMKSARAGHAINEEDIPPPVAIPKPKPPPPPAPAESENDVPEVSQSDLPPPLPPRQIPSRPAPTPPSGTNSALFSGELSISAQLIQRRDQYKVAALRAKKAGDTETAIKYVRTAKKFDAVIEAEKNGQPVDLSNMPPPPPEFASNVSVATVVDKRASQDRMEEEKKQASSQPSELEAAALAAASGPEDPGVFNAPPPPSTILEALQQRLEKFSSTRDSAKAEGNNSKARRLHRIVQQYETAIKNYKVGKPVDFEELPTPPGFAPIPVEGSAPVPRPQVPPPKPASPMPPKEPRGEGAVSPASASKPAAPGQKGPSPAGANKGKLQRTNTSSVLEKQLNFLLERQKLFRQAALESKKNGDIQQAKEYLRMSKGFDSMIEATRSGLPIDATSIPTPPQLEADFVIIEKSDCVEEMGGENSEEAFRTVEKDLEQQIEICARNKDHFLRLGDVSSASKFEKLGLNSKKDLAVVRHKWLNNDGLPRFHYETRLFSMVQCHTDLGDNDIEVSVERGINLPGIHMFSWLEETWNRKSIVDYVIETCGIGTNILGKPDDLDSYVRIELPLPPENPLRAKTHTVRDTNNPIFQETFKFEFNRKSRSVVRHFKRQGLKLEVWSKGSVFSSRDNPIALLVVQHILCKGGFLRSDTLLGIASVKLVDLESKCAIHDSFDLMEGRKACGGKIEVKVRIRDPLLAKQVEEVREKWLVIGS